MSMDDIVSVTQGRRHEILARQDRHTANAVVGLAGLTYDGGPN